MFIIKRNIVKEEVRSFILEQVKNKIYQRKDWKAEGRKINDESNINEFSIKYKKKVTILDIVKIELCNK